jgi:hypothetical protein
MGGKGLKHPHYFAVQTDGKHGDGADTEIAADIEVDAGIILRVFTQQGASGAHTFAGKARLGIELRTQCGGAMTSAGVAEHELALAQSYGGSAGQSEHLGLFGDQAQFGIESLRGRAGRGRRRHA